ncbi:MAG: carbamoyl-phosphate synthase large subunit, partial [Planctomycetes bacterium]|nr:carbamoyl-phosphate synthase large subunit [Planctomycetota bacterium]
AEAEAIAGRLGLPVVVRPAYTMGGTGGGIVYNMAELREIAARGLAASMVHQVLIEEYVGGWEELELEVVRDSKDQLLTICFIENIDPMGVHTGDSFCVAPMLTISEELKARLQKYSYDIVRAIGVIGGTNVQFAHDPVSDRVVVIEINPRTSRSSALASKATGFPIAMVSALLAAGMTLDEMPYWRDGTLEKYTPSGDYMVAKFARWAFEKFAGVQDKLGTQMRAVGEVMSIGRTWKETMQKAIRSLENGRYGLGMVKELEPLSKETLLERVTTPTSLRQFEIYEALKKGATVEEIYARTKIKTFFLEQMLELVQEEAEIRKHTLSTLPPELFKQAKQDGFADKYLAKLLNATEPAVRARRQQLGIVQGWHPVPVSGVKDAYYYYSSYNAPDDTPVSAKKKIMVLGGGPNRIGQGIEFDYCCVHAAYAIRKAGYEAIMVNCNPETVSTDYDTADKLYFEPLTVEDVLAIYEKEKPEGVVVQFGGQTPLNIATELENAGVKVIGTPPDIIDLANDRDRFHEMMIKLGIPQPESGMAITFAEAKAVAARIGYPLIVRPSFVLGGRAMEVVRDEEHLERYLSAAVDVSPERPVIINRFLENAIEAEADAVSDGADAFVPSVMEQVEFAGVHSGDSACVIPPISIPPKHLETIEEYTKKIAVALGVVGLMNIQYAIANDTVYIIEANPRASRTVPLVSKVCDIPMANLGTQMMLGKKLSDLKIERKPIRHFGVKEAVFPFNMFPEVDPVLGPEMRSTGEVLGMADNFGLAFYKAQDAAKSCLPTEGTVLITVANADKKGLLPVARKFVECGFKIMATSGTRDFLAQNGIESALVGKLREQRPHVVDVIQDGQVSMIVNTPKGVQMDDAYIRKAAIANRIPYMTTIAAALAAVKGIAARKAGIPEPRSLQDYHGRG